MMNIDRRAVLGAAAAGALPFRSARSQAANTIRIGVLNDQSGPYRDLSGPYGVMCTQQAVAEFGQRGFNVEVVNADHQNRPDVGANIARQWYDQGVDVIIDVPTSSVGLAVNNVAREKNKAYLNTGSATSDLTGAQCSPNTIHWMYDTYMLAKSTGAAMVRAGGDSWYFITADYAFGHALERDTGNFVRAAGGRVVGSVRYPFPATTDFSSFLLQAQAARPKVIGFANAGADLINSIKQASEFGVTRRGIKLAALLMFLPDVHSIGLETAQGLVLTEKAGS
jgi:branched-chain amino acid transport system substrate-binding protein